MKKRSLISLDSLGLTDLSWCRVLLTVSRLLTWVLVCGTVLSSVA